MKSYTIKLQKPGTKLEKQNQLAWLIANMAAEDWDLNKKIIIFLNSSTYILL